MTDSPHRSPRVPRLFRYCGDVCCLNLVMEYHAVTVVLRFENSLQSNVVAVVYRQRRLSINEDRATAGRTSQRKCHFLAAGAGRRFSKQRTHHSLKRNALMVKLRRIGGDRADIGLCRVACLDQSQHNKRCTYKRSQSIGESVSHAVRCYAPKRGSGSPLMPRS
jgi:hypothetical protein